MRRTHVAGIARMPSWAGKVVAVTGGSAGLGREVAATFLQAGASVILLARDPDRLRTVTSELSGIGPRVQGIAADVTHQVDVDRAFQEIRQAFGRLDVLVNVAGVSSRGTIEETTPEELTRLLDLNLLGSVRCTRAALAMLQASNGSLVFVGSLAGKIAAPFLGGYPASKFAVSGYAQQARLELSPQVHVLLVCPGPIQREDASSRYAASTTAIPTSARRPGGGVHLAGLDPQTIAREIQRACERRIPELVLPRRARLLAGIAQWFPGLGDWIVKRMTR